MPIALNYWSPDGGTFGRIYVNGLPGLPVGAKAFLQRRRGSVVVGFQGDCGDVADADVLAAVRSVVPEGELDWERLVDFALARAGRGRRPGTTAASRAFAAPEGSWSAADAAAIGADMKTHPIPEPTRLFVDHREPGRMIDLLRTVRNLEVEPAALDRGDYAVPGRLVVERKTVQDFVTSIVEDEKRLFHQTESMAKSDVPAVLLIEGDIYGQRRMTLPQLAGALSFIVIVQNVSVVPTLGLEHSAMMIAKLVRHAAHGLGYDLGLRGAAPRDPPHAAAFVLEGIPGVSAARSRALLATFGSLAAVAAADEASLRRVDGIGPKTAKMIVATFRAGPPA